MDPVVAENTLEKYGAFINSIQTQTANITELVDTKCVLFYRTFKRENAAKTHTHTHTLTHTYIYIYGIRKDIETEKRISASGNDYQVAECPVTNTLLQWELGDKLQKVRGRSPLKVSLIRFGLDWFVRVFWHISDVGYLMLYIYIYKLADRNQERLEGSLFNNYYCEA